MNRHAYCIMAHNEPELLRALVAELDDDRNDIFIHVDAKADVRQFAGVTCSHSRLVWTPRLKIYWGDYSFIETELLLLHVARANGDYRYYHLLSGVDFPLKSQDAIHEYFEQHDGEEFVSFVMNDANLCLARNRTKYYYPFIRQYKLKNGKLRRIFICMSRWCIAIQRFVGICRNRSEKFYKGSNWVSITGDFVAWLLDRRKKIRQMFRYALCGDEIFAQTLIMNSPFSERVSEAGNLREIDWERGDPYTWRFEDFDSLKKSKCFFARKFSSDDMRVIEALHQSQRMEISDGRS